MHANGVRRRPGKIAASPENRELAARGRVRAGSAGRPQYLKIIHERDSVAWTPFGVACYVFSINVATPSG